MAYPEQLYGQFRDELSGVPSYAYQPLPPNNIRLLKIYEDHESAEIQCNLDVEPLDNHPRFAALSYTWQDPPIFGNQPT
jgi:hypothetical protein